MEFDPIWEEKYSKGHAERYPWDSVVSFVYRNSNHKERKNIKILEVGCGTGSNLWFAAREGFQVFGIEASESAINYARNRFIQEGLNGDFVKSSFTNIPFPDNFFDIVIDRAALIHTGKSNVSLAIQEIHRSLLPGGKFLFTPYTNENSSAALGSLLGDGLTMNISGGTLQGVGQISFFSKEEVYDLFKNPGWNIISFETLTREEEITKTIHQEFHVVVQKK